MSSDGDNLAFLGDGDVSDVGSEVGDFDDYGDGAAVAFLSLDKTD